MIFYYAVEDMVLNDFPIHIAFPYRLILVSEIFSKDLQYH